MSDWTQNFVIFFVCLLVLIGHGVLFGFALWGGHKISFPDDDPHVGYQPGGTSRGTLNLVWSCLSTIFICLYASVHTSVPNSNAAKWKKMVSKIGLVGIGLLAPEAIVMLSAADFFEAMRGTKELRRVLRNNPPSRTNVEKAERPKGKSFDDDRGDGDNHDDEDENISKTDRL